MFKTTITFKESEFPRETKIDYLDDGTKIIIVYLNHEEMRKLEQEQEI